MKQAESSSDAVHPSPARKLAGRHAVAHARFWFVAAAVLAVDLWSKAYIFALLSHDEARTLIPGVLELRRSLNDGAVFGLFTGYVGLFLLASVFALVFVIYMFLTSERRQVVLHVALGMILAGALGNFYDRTFAVADIVTIRRPDAPEATIIGRVLNGSDEAFVRVGHWPDGADPRTYPTDSISIERQGVVRDFLRFTLRFPSWVPRLGGGPVWPWVFNVADASLVCGVVLLLLCGWLYRERSHAPFPASREAASNSADSTGCTATDGARPHV